MTRGLLGVGAGLAAVLLLAGCDRSGGEDEATTEAPAAEAPAADDGAAPAAPGDAPPAKAPAGDAADGKVTSGPAPAAAAAAGEEAQFHRLISGYLDTYAENVGGGWPRARGVADEIAAINAGQEHRWRVDLERGRTYAFVGACDNECDNVDLVVEDASGREVGRDDLTDDYPLVQFTPPASGRYTARIMLVTCTVEPCYVGGRLLQR